MAKVTRKRDVSRRDFVKGSAFSALALAGSGAVAGLVGCAAEPQPAEPVSPTDVIGEVPDEGTVVWNVCNHCGFTICPIKFHIVDGTVRYVEGNVGDAEFGGDGQRACLKGRSLRKLINSPNRLKYPMKRVEGTKRGEGIYERISWDEALDLVHEKWQYTLDNWGPEAVFMCNTGVRTFPPYRLAHMLGGRLDAYGSESNGQASQISPFLLGSGLSPFSALQGVENVGYVNVVDSETSSLYGSYMTAVKDSDVILLVGFGPAESRMSGMSEIYELAKARERGTKIYCVDFRLSDACSGHPEEWIPIKPGTDGAFAAAVNYVLINEGMADEEFLHKCTVGYDETNMPEGAPPNSSFKDYILGTGYDMVPKTPEWASPICGVPVDTIVEIANVLGNAKAAFIVQGWGPQRHFNGEMACLSIIMMSLISGNIGLPGTNPGNMPPMVGYNDLSYGLYNSAPPLTNPVPLSIPNSARFDAIYRGEEMTALNHGVRGGEKLNTSIKFMVCLENGSINGSSADANWCCSIIEDESLCEFILGCDIVMSPSMKYCDLILPDLCYPERPNIIHTSSAGAQLGVIFGTPVQEPQFECRNAYDWCADLAERFGMRDEYTEGKTFQEWQTYVYGEYIQPQDPDLPATVEEGYEMGFFSKHNDDVRVVFTKFREDPEANPRSTESGKLEIYSTALAKVIDTWELAEDEILTPVPTYTPDFEGVEQINDTHPLQFGTWKAKNQYHGRFGCVDILQDAVHHSLWINPIDAEPRGIANGDSVRVFNDRGTLEVTARVTPRIIPGVVGMPEGHWRNVDANGVDMGGNPNTLTSHRWSPYAKHGPTSGSTLVQVEKA